MIVSKQNETKHTCGSDDCAVVVWSMLVRAVVTSVVVVLVHADAGVGACSGGLALGLT